MYEGIVPDTPSSLAHAAFTGENGEFRRLVTRGALLELVTFGFYRFWLATNIRRHLWSNSSVAGDALEYTGTGRELLIGFLFALAILAPIYLVYFVIGIEAERWQAFASIPFGLLYYGFWQFAAYRARRYRLTRTLWRGVRFWMAGSGTAYALRAFGWTVLTVLTLGLAYPWRAAALERYKMGHTFYGDLPGRFEGKGWDFFKRGWWLWLLALLALGFSGAVIDMDVVSHEAVVAQVGILAGASMLVFPFLYAAFKATEWTWWVQGLRFGQGQREVRFDSDLTRGALIGNIWKMIGAGLLVSLAAAASLLAVIWFGLPFIAARLTGLVPLSLEKRLGDVADGRVHAMFGGKTCTRPEGTAGLVKLVGALQAKAQLRLPPEPAVLAFPIPNAFALPGGKVYVLKGLLEKAEAPDELAGVLAHEFGHVAHRDGLRRLIEDSGTGFLVGLLFGDVTGASVVLGAGRGLLSAAYSRDAEANADRFALELMEKLGRSPKPLGDLLLRISGPEKDDPLSIFASHPMTADRMAMLGAAGGDPAGEPLLSFGEWRALKAICK